MFFNFSLIFLFVKLLISNNGIAKVSANGLQNEGQFQTTDQTVEVPTLETPLLISFALLGIVNDSIQRLQNYSKGSHRTGDQTFSKSENANSNTKQYYYFQIPQDSIGAKLFGRTSFKIPYESSWLQQLKYFWSSKRSTTDNERENGSPDSTNHNNAIPRKYSISFPPTNTEIKLVFRSYPEPHFEISQKTKDKDKHKKTAQSISTDTHSKDIESNAHVPPSHSNIYSESHNSDTKQPQSNGIFSSLLTNSVVSSISSLYNTGKNYVTSKLQRFGFWQNKTASDYEPTNITSTSHDSNVSHLPYSTSQNKHSNAASANATKNDDESNVVIKIT